METSEYTNIRQMEEEHWWYSSTHRRVLAELQGLEEGKRVLDIGSGTGGLLRLMKDRFRVFGIDVALEGAREASRRPGLSGAVMIGEAEAVPFLPGRFDAVTCIDVIYHERVASERAALAEMRRILKPGGRLVLQVPAFECLRGGHDRVVHTRKRYRRAEVRALLREAGFRVLALGYRYSWLFPPALVVRRLSRGSARTDLRPVHPLVNACLGAAGRLSDSRFFPRLPFGTSLFAVGEKIP